MKKKLIEVTLPLEKINAEAGREKSIRHGHPSTLHTYWARRPLAACRAVLFASLVNDPGDDPRLSPEEQEAERTRLHGLIERLVKWESIGDEGLYREALAEIMKSTNGNPPAILDPFAGGGSIPLEAQRLGLAAYAGDLNPVAVLINKALIEIPPRFANLPPVNPVARAEALAPSKSKHNLNTSYSGSAGLRADVRYYGELLRKRAAEQLEHLYPKAIDPETGRDHTVIAWLWARTIRCSNPTCGCEMPLANSFVLCKKPGHEAYIFPVIERGGEPHIRYEVRHGKGAPEPPKIARGQFKCIACEQPVDGDYIKAEGKAKRIGARLMAIVAEGEHGRLYLSPTEEHERLALECTRPEDYPDGKIVEGMAERVIAYGYTNFADLFTNRQLRALTCFCDFVGDIIAAVEKDARDFFRTKGAKTQREINHERGLAEGGRGAHAYAQAIAVYLAFVLDKMLDLSNSFCSWEIDVQCARYLFSRQSIPIIWDYAESNPLGNSSGSWNLLLKTFVDNMDNGFFDFYRRIEGKAEQRNAMDMEVGGSPPPGPPAGGELRGFTAGELCNFSSCYFHGSALLQQYRVRGSLRFLLYMAAALPAHYLPQTF